MEVSARAEAVVEDFARTTSPSSDDYRALLAYFVEGFLTYRDEAGADFQAGPVPTDPQPTDWKDFQGPFQ